MTKKLNKVDENVKEFLNRYGKEGFLQLFLTNYLYELIQYFLHSKMRGEDDLSLSYYTTHQKKLYSSEEIKSFEDKLRKECNIGAKRVVEELKRTNLIDKIDSFPPKNPKVARIISDEFEHIMSQVGRRD